MNGPFALARSGVLLPGVIADDRVDHEAPVAPKLGAQVPEKLQYVWIEGHAGGDLGWGHA